MVLCNSYLDSYRKQICEKLGWKGKGGRFDVLPWVLQANGEDPDFYDVPPELVLEVKITHPELVKKYYCVVRNHLKWCAPEAFVNKILVYIRKVS